MCRSNIQLHDITKFIRTPVHVHLPASLSNTVSLPPVLVRALPAEPAILLPANAADDVCATRTIVIAPFLVIAAVIAARAARGCHALSALGDAILAQHCVVRPAHFEVLVAILTLHRFPFLAVGSPDYLLILLGLLGLAFWSLVLGSLDWFGLLFFFALLFAFVFIFALCLSFLALRLFLALIALIALSSLLYRSPTEEGEQQR